MPWFARVLRPGHGERTSSPDGGDQGGNSCARIEEMRNVMRMRRRIVIIE